MYTIILQDGTRLENLGLNGNNYISNVELTKQDFENKLDNVTIIDENGSITNHTNMKLIYLEQYSENEWYFILNEKSQQEILNEILEEAIIELAELIGG